MSRRWTVMIPGLAIAWFALILVWAIRPLPESINVAAEGAPVIVEVRCAGLFSSAEQLAPLPELTGNQAYSRPPCAGVHRQARLVFILDTVVVLLVLAGCALIYKRRQMSDLDDAAELDDTVTATGRPPT